MCIALFKPLNKKLDKEIYENCFSNNDDGAGFAFIDGGKLFTAKGYFSFKEFWNDYSKLEEKASLVHFRVGTSGGNNGENCHPWRVNEDLVFVHNGVISSIERENPNWSDTGNFCENILKPLTKEFPEWWKQPEFKWIMENAIGSGNKIALLGSNGEHLILNEKSGEKHEDCWFSNGSFKYSRYNSRTSCLTSKSRDSSAWGADPDDEKTNNQTSIEEEYLDIDVESIDARLEEAEKKRLEDKNNKIKV